MKRSFDNFGQATEYSMTTVNTNTRILNSFYELIPKYDANNRLIEVQRNRQSYENNVLKSSIDFYNKYNLPIGSNNNVKEYTQQILPTASPSRRTVATHTADDRLQSLRGSVSRQYEHDEDGNLKSITNCYGKTIYEYDDFSNLKKVSFAGGKVVEYKIDGQNRRVKKLINGVAKEYYLWYDQIHLAAVLDENKVPKITYIYGPESQSPSYMIKNGVAYRIVHDPGLGSIRYVIDPTTLQIEQELEYDEFGNLVKNTNPGFQPLSYAGGLSDMDTKLIRFGARDYDPTIGRWTTKDPIGFAGGDTNLYAYVGGNPMSYFDSNGLDRETIRDWSGGIPHDTLHLFDPQMPGNSVYIDLTPAGGKPNVANNLFNNVPGQVNVSDDRPLGGIIPRSSRATSHQQNSLSLSQALEAQRRALRGELEFNLFSGPYNQNSSTSNCRRFADGL